MIKTQFKKSGEIHLKAKTGPLGALGDGTAKVVNQVYQYCIGKDVSYTCINLKVPIPN